MEFIGNTWNALVVQNIETALTFLFGLLSSFGLPSWGLTIIVFTLIVKLITAPLTGKSFASSRAMQRLQPQLKALQQQYKNDREKLMPAQMQLYREAGVNPMAGCLPMLIQMPIWIGLYSALFELSTHEEFRQSFLWISDLGQPEGFPYILAILTGVSQFITQKMMTPPTTDPQQQMTNQIMQFMPIMFVFFAFTVPAGLVIYWVASNVFTMGQYYIMMGGMPATAAPAAAGSTGGDSLISRLMSRTAREGQSAVPAQLPPAAPPESIDSPPAASGDGRVQSARRRRGRRR